MEAQAAVRETGLWIAGLLRAGGISDFGSRTSEF